MVKKSPASAHTPGPWRVCHSTNAQVYDGEPHLAVQQHPETGTGIILADIETSPGPDIAEANANLIAAAPELLAACKTALEDALMAITGEWDIGSTECPTEGFRCLAEYLEQVIAAAEGRKPKRPSEDLRRAAA